MIKLRRIVIALVLWATGCTAPIANMNSEGTNIICFGDSLTQGYGADAGQDYPSLLGQKVKLPVINAGISGNNTRDALQRLDQDVLEHNPRIVIMTLGGNDFLQQIPKEETLQNIGMIIDRIHRRGAMVVWATVKTGVFADGYTKDFQKLAREKRVLLISDILHDVMQNPQLRYDQLHPNSEGYKLIAERIYRAIKYLLK